MSGTKLTDVNRLSIVHPELIKEWNYEKNYPLKPEDFRCNSHVEPYWKCCECGHEWQTRIGHRSAGRGCPKCARIYYKLDKSLEELCPHLMKEWHPTLNLPLTPDRIGRGSSINAWWICEKGHEWQAIISSRVHGNGCPYCSGYKVNLENCLATTFPEIAKQWHPTKNGKLTPYDVSKGTQKKVWWLGECGHEWQAYISIRTGQNTQCPYCNSHLLSTAHNLLVCNPKIAKEWHPTKNGKVTPEDVTPLTNEVFYWQCFKGHVWRARVSHRSRGTSNCPYCSKVQLKDGTFFHSLTEAFWYLGLKKYGFVFICNKMYNTSSKDEIGKCRYDFYFPQQNLYLEVTSFNKKWRGWKKYIKKIERKQEYVEKKLGGIFVFIQYTLTDKDRKLVQNNLK